MTFACMSDSTLLSQPGRAVAGRFLQTSQIDEERPAPPATLAVPLGLDRPRSVDHEAGPDQRRHQRRPSGGLLVGEHDDHPPVVPERLAAALEGTRHPVLVGVPGLRAGPAEATRLIDQLAVVRTGIPLSDDTIVIRHCIPVPAGPPTRCGANGDAAEVSDRSSYLSGRGEDPRLKTAGLVRPCRQAGYGRGSGRAPA